MPPDRVASPDIISEQLGLEHLHRFSIREFLSGTFATHSWEEFEQRLGVGSTRTTPPLSIEMADLPKPWLFVRIMAGASLAYLILLLLLTIYQRSAIYLLPAHIFYGCFAIPFAVLSLFFEFNTPNNVSMAYLAKVLMIGGAISFLVTFILFDAFPLEKLYGASSAGIIEEVAKLLVIIFFARQFIATRHSYTLNGLLYGATVGTGFAAFESAGYALNAGLSGNSFSALNQLIVSRGVLSPFTHIPWSAIAGGAMWLAFNESQNRKLTSAIFSVRFISLFTLSVALHFLWNFDFGSYFGYPDYVSMAQVAILGLAAWLVVIRLLATGLKEIRLETEKVQLEGTAASNV